MAHCTILYPGLLGPDAPLEELARSEWPDNAILPNLALLLNRGQAYAIQKQPFEYQALTSLGYVIGADSELPIAALRQQEDVARQSPLWCLDPVYVRIDQEMAYVAARDELALSEQEARQLIASLNQHFADVLQIRYHNPQQWLVQIALQVSTSPLTHSMLQDVNRMQPQGEDAQRWHALLNEIQMLLHAHPVNEARVQAGKLPVNSLWLWGGGRIDTVATAIDVVYANDALVADAAVRNAIAHATLPRKIEAALFDTHKVLLVVTEQMPAIQQRDVYGWFAALKYLEQHFLSPLLGLLKNGKLDQLVLASDTMGLVLDKKALRKWWRRNQGIDANILQFRKRYGH